MVNAVGSYGSYMNYLQTLSTKNRPDPAEMFKKVDTDGSGGISQTELATFADKLSQRSGQTIDTSNAISTYDADGNGELSSTELKSFLDASGVKPPPPPGGIEMGMVGMQGGSGPEDLFSALDTDGSEGISQAELETWAQDMSSETGQTIDTSSAIDTYDTDGDGVLSSTELQAFLDASGIKPPATEEQQASQGNSGVSFSQFLQQVIAAYVMNLEDDQASNMLDFFNSNQGTQGSYTPVDLSV